MRALYIHAGRFVYKSLERAIKDPPDEGREGSYENALVVFVSIERGDDEGVASRLAADAASHAAKVGAKIIVIYPYAHLSSNLAPPRDAIRVMRAIEAAIRERWSGEVERAPFGWYKAFEISCLGHPLSELSRSFSSDDVVAVADVPLEEALKRGMVREELCRRSATYGELEDIAKRLDLDGAGSRIMMLKIEQAMAEALAVSSYKVADRREVTHGLWGSAAAYKLCAPYRKGTFISFGPPGDSIAIGDPQAALTFLSSLHPRLTEGLETVELTEPRTRATLYVAKGGGLPIMVETQEGVCLGPAKNILLALLDRGIRDAEEGLTPSLPCWLSPIQAAILPVGEAQMEWAKEVERSLRERGIRTALFTAGNLGNRIREAGRLWIPIVIVVGEREASTKTVSVRVRAEPGRQEVMRLEELLSLSSPCVR